MPVHLESKQFYGASLAHLVYLLVLVDPHRICLIHAYSANSYIFPSHDALSISYVVVYHAELSYVCLQQVGSLFASHRVKSYQREMSLKETTSLVRAIHTSYWHPYARSGGGQASALCAALHLTSSAKSVGWDLRCTSYEHCRPPYST